MYHYILDKDLNVRETEKYIEKGPQKKKRRQKTKGFTRNQQIALNSVNQCIKLIEKMGIRVITETEDNDDEVKVTLRFPRD